MAIYNLIREGRLPVVKCDGKILDPSFSLEIVNHSPDGFEWGYQGSGPAQLALAILLQNTDLETAVIFHQDFKREVISSYSQNENHVLTSTEVSQWLSSKKV